MVQVPYSDKQMAPACNTSSCLMLIICKHQMHFSSECRKSDSLRILNRKWVSPSANTNLKRIPYCTSNISSIKHMDVLGDLPAGPHNPSGVPPMCSETLKQPLVTPTWSPQTESMPVGGGVGKGLSWLPTHPHPSCISALCYSKAHPLWCHEIIWLYFSPCLLFLPLPGESLPDV